jgi:hypothetical protein
MKKLNPSEVWNALSEKQQWKVLNRLIGRLHGKSLPAGAINLGIGYRTFTSAKNRKKYSHTAQMRRNTNRREVLIASSKHPRVLTSDLCLRFYVKTKVRKPQNPLPKVVRTSVLLRGKRKACNVPTDVAIAHGGSPQAYFRSTGQIGGLRAGGCCVVAKRSDHSQKFLLGCHHALTLSMINSAAENQPAALPIDLMDADTGDILGSTFDWSDLTPANGVGFDAALALAGPQTIWPQWFRDNLPTQLMASAYPPKQVTIHSPRGDLIAEFVDYIPSAQLEYGNQTLLIGPIFQFTAQTQEGDSGSAVSDGNSLCGMHFYGQPAAQSALALTANSLFESGKFSFPITLP